ncbi:TPA: hypothetical protein N0F65_006118 [Lagenidium giganteum]|uniref:RING-type domain-containing protein n=1 Tax=Lagenidium giganteum TaxID=4803 RepID=A0AAV2Z6E8_9STRA|nr:TPA: hypothetical protein N0F65_006118 [Lagenidium giganteum]
MSGPSSNKRGSKRDILRNHHEIEGGRATRNGVSANHLLNFSLPERTKPGFTKKKTKAAPMRTQNEYLLANFRFVISPVPNDVYLSCWDMEALTDWRYVEQLLLWCDKEMDNMQCPICLDELRAPKVTRCGHIFWYAAVDNGTALWPCILRYLSLADNYWRRCPMCFESVQKSHLRSVKLQYVQLPPRVNSETELKCLQRSKSSLFPHVRMTPLEQAAAANANSNIRKLTHLPSVYDANALFARILEATPEYILHLVREEMVDMERLDAELRSSGEVETIPFVEEALRHASGRLENPTVREEAEPAVGFQRRARDEEDTSDCYTFYQIENGSYVMLHPLNMRCLMKEFAENHHTQEETADTSLQQLWTQTPEDQAHLPPTSAAPQTHLLPLSLRAKVLDVEHMVMDDETQKRFRFLSHLPRFCDFYLCELDLSELLSRETLDAFKPELKKREKQRKAKQEAARKKTNAVRSPAFKGHVAPSFTLEEEGTFWPAPGEAVAELSNSFHDALLLSTTIDPNELSPSLRAAMMSPPLTAASPPSYTFMSETDGSFATITRKSGYFPRLGGDEDTSATTVSSPPTWGAPSAWAAPPAPVSEGSKKGKKKGPMKKGTSLFSTTQQRSYR